MPLHRDFSWREFLILFECPFLQAERAETKQNTTCNGVTHTHNDLQESADKNKEIYQIGEIVQLMDCIKKFWSRVSLFSLQHQKTNKYMYTGQWQVKNEYNQLHDY